MEFLEKKVSRREFIWSAVAGLGVLFLGNFGNLAKSLTAKSTGWQGSGNAYGNNAYGGGARV